MSQGLFPILFISLGGIIGSLSRYFTTVFLARYELFSGSAMIYLVNSLGCLLAGILFEWLPRDQWTSGMRFFLMTGFLGSYTTFSAFAFELFYDAKSQAYTEIAVNLFLGVFLPLLSFFIGFMSLRLLRSIL